MGFLEKLPVIGRLFRKGGEGPVSLVMLLDRVPSIGEAEVGAAARGAFPGAEMLGEIPGPSGPGIDTNHMLSVGEGIFGVIVSQQAYVEDREQLAATIGRADFAAAVRSHEAWVSVDSFVVGDAEAAYRVIGPVAAALMPEGCVGLYMPARGRFSFPSPALLDAMRSGDWLGAFDEVGSDPVVQRPGDDEALAEAAREARARLPEFLDAFRRGAGEGFAVKVPLREGDAVEHVWLVVRDAESDRITGVVNNEVRFLARVREGDEVTVGPEEVEDWLFMRGGAMQGGFSVKVLAPDLAGGG